MTIFPQKRNHVSSGRPRIKSTHLHSMHPMPTSKHKLRPKTIPPSPQMRLKSGIPKLLNPITQRAANSLSKQYVTPKRSQIYIHHMLQHL